jgi:putative oxidoreductase
MHALLFGGTHHGRLALVVRVVAGAIVAGFGVGKFTHHGAESAALDRYGIPFSDVTTLWVGLVELGCGACLVLGLLTRPAALALAANFVVAISTAGRLEGGPIHLGLAPALLASMLFLLWRGPGERSLDGRIVAARAARQEASASGTSTASATEPTNALAAARSSTRPS